MQTLNVAFWKVKKLAEMNSEEWESLCDRCGRCCLNKIEDDEDGHLYYTNVACSLLDADNGHCLSYEERFKLKSDCLELTPDNVKGRAWLPATCAYRLLSEGKELLWWHPLVSGDMSTVSKAGISICGNVVSEDNIHQDQLQDHVVDWI